MRIGCLQFAPKVGDVDNNLNLADDILNRTNPEDLDLLVLPELAFSGYNFKTLREIYPHLEPTGSGITSVWARTTALKYNCAVAVGYPESADVSYKWPTSPEYYNSLILVNQDGDTWALYRKSHLYYTDESWALEGSDGFWKGYLPGVGKLAMGICMDINPYRFEAPWDEFEFATHALKHSANVVIVSMAWLTHDNPSEFTTHPKEPDMDTLTYWVQRMEPMIRCESEEEIIIIFANRSGMESDVLYAGTSAVLGIQGGEVTVYGLLGRGENELLVVDTSQPGLAKLVYRPEGETDISVKDGTEGRDSDAMSQTPQGPRTKLSDHQHNTLSETEYHAAERTNEPSRRAGGHVFIPSDAVSTQTLEVAAYIDNESPISPRYFWNPPGTNTGSQSQVPSFSINNTYEQWHAMLNQDDGRSEEIENDDIESITSDIEPVSEFSALVEGLSHSKSQQEAVLSRPFSTKSQNASRNQKHRSAGRSTQLSNNVSNDGVSHSYTSTVPEDTGPRVAARDRHGTTYETSGIATHQAGPRSPDLEKIDADLMVFEEEGTVQQKRDSLLCHVDDDDYIVLQTARKDRISRHPKSVHSPARSSRSSSIQRPRQSGSKKQDDNRSNLRGSELDKDGYEIDKSKTRTPIMTHQKQRSGQLDVLSPFPSDTKSKTQRSHIPTDARSSLSSQRSRQLARQENVTHYENGGTDFLHEVPGKKSKRGPQYGGSSALARERTSDIPVVFSPDILDRKSRLNASAITSAGTPETGIAFTDAVPDNFSLTPKAMVFDDKEILSSPALSQAMSALALNYQCEATDIAVGRPRSAIS